MIKYAYVSLLSAFFVACATDADRAREAAARKVQVIMYEYPQCNYQMVGMITTDVKRSQNAAIEDARERAVDVGAEYLSIMSIGKYALDQTSVSGKAFVCHK